MCLLLIVLLTDPFLASFVLINGSAYLQDPPSHSDTIYVVASGSNAVNVVEGTKVVATIPVGIKPFADTFDSTHRLVFVSNFQDNTVSVISSRSNSVVRTLTGFRGPTGLLFVKHSKMLYVSEYLSNDVAIVNPESGQIISRVKVGSEPADLAYSPESSDVYVSNTNSDTVSAISTGTEQLVTSITVDNGPRNIAFDQANEKIYVANLGSGLDHSGTVSVIDSENHVIKTIVLPLHSGPWALTYNEANHDIYVGDANFNGRVFVIGSDNTIIAKFSLEGFSVLAGATFDPSNGAVYFSDYQHSQLYVIKGTSLVKIVRSGLGQQPFGMTVAVRHGCPDQESCPDS